MKPEPLGTSGQDRKRMPSYIYKKCPECLTELPLDAKGCISCRKKVGGINKFGLAKKPPDWKAYTSCFLAWAAFALYMKWAFF